MSSVRPKKSLGQHFLKDLNIAQKIAESLLDANQYPLLEIGPGTGVLTAFLIDKYPDLHLIEIDHESVAYLKQHFPTLSNRIIHDDFLELNIESLFPDKFNIIGNFPYNISSQIFFAVLANRHKVDQVVCMIQKEVAERIAEPPGSKTYGILSVLLQAFYRIEYLFTVNENVFYPPPKVKSAVIRLVRNEVQQLPCDEQLFHRIVKATFNQRRKVLRNTLKSIGDISAIPEELLLERPEQLGVSEFVRLTQLMSK
jgi:16S rRNA (adenine1518-N6/adenine1519-N6)-dimethyltransferase